MILPVPSQIARTQGSDAVIYYQVDQQTIADYPRGGAAASPTYRYFWASYIDELIARKATGSGGELLFGHRNQQYSILSLSDSSGAVVERVSYTAYGQPNFTNAAGTTLSSSGKANRYYYTGREWDPSLQLHHFRARWMSAVSGRFLGRDPNGLIDRYCRPDCQRERKPNGSRPNPLQKDLPIWVPRDHSNDIVQDGAVIAGCVVVGTLGRSAVIRCCPRLFKFAGRGNPIKGTPGGNTGAVLDDAIGATVDIGAGNVTLPGALGDVTGKCIWRLVPYGLAP